MTVDSRRFLISGAGIAGLLTAQALKARGLDFVIFDRDCNVQYREHAGWAITLHWALETFLNLLPKELAEEVYDAQVRKDFHLHDTGNFKYINASDGTTVVSIPPSKRLRVRREQVRRTLLKGIDVQWDCKLEKITHNDAGRVNVTCASGQEFEGDVLLSCDGANSQIRRLLCGEAGNLNYLPLRFCGAKVKISEAELDELSARFDPLLFQGTVPESNTFFWFSVLSMPDYTKEKDGYYAQVNISWNAPKDTEEPFETNEEKAAALIQNSVGLHPDLYVLAERAAKEPNNIVEIKLADWPEVEWNSHSGSILLLGDAAHAMTMYRGEAANHGITDVAELIAQIDKYTMGQISWREAAASYCASVKERAQEAVLLSRQACLDAHDITKIRPDSDSPLLSKRKKT